MADDLGSFLAATKAKESGGDYTAYNPDFGTTGAYQYKNATWGNFKGYARAMDAPPAIQDEKARLDAQSLYARFGNWRDVAIAWYGGPGAVSAANKNASEGKYPTINQYANDIVSRMGGTTATGQVGTVTTQQTATGTQQTPLPGIDPRLPLEDQITALAYSQHGAVLAPFINDPEIRAILRRYVNREIDEATMIGLVQQTNVYRTTDLSHRQWQDLKASDPATAAKKLEQSKFTIARTAEQLGYAMKPEDIDFLAERVIYDGLSPDQVQSLIVGHFAMTGGGNAGAAYATVNDALGNWMVRVDDGTKQQWVTDILMGRMTPETLNAHLRDVNATQYPGMATALQQNPNLTPQAYVAPIRSTISQLMGINAQDVDFMDPKWKALVNYYDPQAKTYRALTDPEIEQTLKSNEAYGWRYTKSGMDTYSGFALNLAQMMGKRPS